MHSNRILRTAVLAAVLVATSAAPVLAAGTTDPSLTDPDDSPGLLDIESASLTQDASNVTFLVNTFEAFDNEDIGGIGFTIDAGNDDDVEYLAVIGLDPEGNLIGGVVSTTTFEPTEGTASRPSADSAQLVFPTSAIGGLSGYGWAVTTADINEEEDVAPDDATVGLPGQVIRQAGADRIDTAIEISKDGWDDAEADAVVLSRSDQFADALAGTPLAVASFGPLLLQPPGDLDSRVAAEIDRVLPDTDGVVHILGGNAAVSPNIDTALEAKGYEVVRHAGDDRYSTAIAVADAVTPAPEAILITTGTNFPDALAAGAAAAAKNGVVVLTAGSTMPAVTQTYLNANQSVTKYAVGGPAAAAAPSAVGLVGADRYATAKVVADTLFADPFVVGVASGTGFADALAGGADLFGLGPLMLTDPNTLSAPLDQYLRELEGELPLVVIYGGTAAVSTAVEDAIRAIVE
jgi:hypothetical protein